MFFRWVMNFNLSTFSFVALALFLAACQPVNSSSVDEVRPLKVVVTTTIIGDVVGQIGADAIDLTVLLSPGADPHIFEPTPRDIAAISQADVVFINGLGLEEFLERFLEENIEKGRLVTLSDGIQPRRYGESYALSHAEDEDEQGHEDDHGEFDPHVWFDVDNVILWTYNIEQKLSELDAHNASLFAENARLYRQRLEDLDAWIVEQVNQIPMEDRKLVSDHASFGYFAGRYGFQQLATVIPNVSTSAAPSAQDVARIMDIINETGAKAIFVGTTVNPDLSRRIAEDTGIRLGMLYTGSLSEPGGPADSYFDMMRYNVDLIVSALK
ncbi:MAG: metal ABC transporter substrate-binding protein [Anaerolineales bacterium]